MQKGQKISSENQVVSLAQYQELLAENMYLKQELAQLKRMIFGSKSERYVTSDPGQLSLDMGLETPVAPEPESEQITYSRKKAEGKKGSAKRLELPSHLHREDHVIEPAEDITQAKKIGELVTEVLEYIPGKFYVVRYIRPKYILTGEEKIVVAELPTLHIPKGNAGPGLLAHLLISKFVDHLPFYRQAGQFKRQDITIAESTISGWFTAACRLLEPLYETLAKKVLGSDYLMADETPIPVLTKDKPGSTHKGYHWVYYSPEHRQVCFDYRRSRERAGPEDFLQSYRGALQSDGYAAYNEFENKEGITLLSCMAHARRKFEQARDNDPERAAYALGKIQQLYAIERQAREEGLTYQERGSLRKEKAVMILKELESWMKAQLPEVLPKSAIGKALTYTLTLWKRLVRYTENGKWEIDNNLIENSIRPVALGRKNYLFAGSHEAAQQAALIYSFLGTCKINNVEPFSWLKQVLTLIPDYSIQKLEDLLPGNLLLPE